MTFNEVKPGMVFKGFSSLGNTLRYVASKDSEKIVMFYLLIARNRKSDPYIEPNVLDKQVISKEIWNSDDYKWMSTKLPTIETQSKYKREFMKKIFDSKLRIKDAI